MVCLDIGTLTLNWVGCLRLGFLRTYYLTCQGRMFVPPLYVINYSIL